MGKEETVMLAEKVGRELRGDVAILTIDNPPLATLAADVRSALHQHIASAQSDPAVRGIVIAGSDEVFAAGASASEEDDGSAPDLAAVCDAIEASKKPVVASIRGSCLGGGLELALATHLRVVHPDARLGSPEITVGLVPKAGGTQRLPKVIGGVAALKLLLSGRAVSGDTAQKLGLSDILAPDDPLDIAITAVRRLSSSRGALRRSSSRRDRLGEGTAFLEAVATHQKAAAQSPLEAPGRMIECVESALLLPYDIGRGLEQAAYDDLVQSEHSRSLRHIFAAERSLQAATRWEGRVESRALDSIAIVGARAESAELIVACLDAGFAVTVAEDSDESLESGVARIIEHFDGRMTAGKMTDEDVEQVLDRMNAVSGFGTLASADVVIDPSTGTTAGRVAELNAAMKAGAVLALATENVDLNEIASASGRAPDILGLRFSSGLRRNRLVEFTTLDGSSSKATATARAFLRKLDRLILDVSVAPQGLGTRIIEALHAAADLCLEDGGRVAQIDAALRDWGIPHGSFRLRDIVGIDRPAGPSGFAGQRGGGLDEALVAGGHLGMIAGRGYFVYRQRGAPGSEDPEVSAMAEADRRAKGVRPRDLSDGEVRKRCLAAMAGAGAQILAEEVVRRPADIDMVAVHGLGFARRTGGVMYAADLVGLEEIHKKLLELSQVTPRIAPPAPLFKDLLASNEGFSSLNS